MATENKILNSVAEILYKIIHLCISAEETWEGGGGAWPPARNCSKGRKQTNYNAGPRHQVFVKVKKPSQIIYCCPNCPGATAPALN